ncbi:unnamed protein product [Rotaria sp. Silwood1]|nr:unnamed protein product [Rotaria sp. Silwood1]
MANIEYRTIIKFFTLKGLNATEITEELKEVAKWVAEFKDDPTRDFKDAPRSGRPSTTTTDENIKAVEHIVMRDRQISVRRVAAELNIPKTIVHEIMSNYLGEKPKSCEYADSSKAFSNSSDRTKHIKRTHLNKKKYKCQIQGCGKSNTDYSCHLSSILTNELSPSSSFCVSALSGGIQQTSISNSNPKITHLIYLCQKLEYN